MSSNPSPSPFGPPQPVQVVCPFCQAVIPVTPAQAGQIIPCPQCAGNFQVPVPTAYSGGSSFATDNSNPAVREFASKKIAAGICGILLGGLGIHKFILGLNNAGGIMLAVYLVGLVTGSCLIAPILASVAMQVIGMVEVIIYLTKSDEEFYQTYAVGRKEWF